MASNVPAGLPGRDTSRGVTDVSNSSTVATATDCSGWLAGRSRVVDAEAWGGHGAPGLALSREPAVRPRFANAVEDVFGDLRGADAY
jgi:hypothetical protein